MFSWLLLFLPSVLAYLDYSDLGCHQMGDKCVPYNPTYDHYSNKFDIAYFFPNALRQAIGSLSLPTQNKIVALKPRIKQHYVSGKAKTAEDALGLIQSHILPNETSILRAGLLFNKLKMSSKVITKIIKLTNILLRAYYTNNNRNSATVVMYAMMELCNTKAFTDAERNDLMSQFSGFRHLINELNTQEFIRGYTRTPLKKRVDKFIEVLKRSDVIPNPRSA